MIRKYKSEDLDTVMELWLIGNTQVHSFIPAKYWRDNFTEIQRVIPLARTYVYEHKGEIKGFISAMENYLVGIFVDAGIQTHGMGTVLLDCVKQRVPGLTATVYEKNVGAVRFFMKARFKVQSEMLDESTGEKQLLLTWEQVE